MRAKGGIVAATAMVAVAVLGGCGPAGASTAGRSSPTPTLCAEFPPTPPNPGDLEGWWNGTPADASGKVLTNPADWPAQLRAHPRTVLVDPATGRVISTWDRRACGPIPDFVPPSGLSGNQVLLLDADSGAVLETLAPHS